MKRGLPVRLGAAKATFLELVGYSFHWFRKLPFTVASEAIV